MSNAPYNHQQEGYIFITGGTGFLGQTFIEKMIQNQSFGGIYVLAKEQVSPSRSAFERIRAIVERIAAENDYRISCKNDSTTVACTGTRHIPVIAISGDITQENLGVSEHHDFGQVTHICHMAALTDIAGAEEAFEEINVQGTANTLEFARRHFSNLEIFGYIGTAYDVYTGEEFHQTETTPPEPSEFVNEYSKSKWIARKLVRESGLPHCIFLPGIITGHSNGHLPENIPLGVIYGPTQALAFLKIVVEGHYTDAPH